MSVQSVRFSREGIEAVRLAAAALGLTTSTFVRQSALIRAEPPHPRVTVGGVGTTFIPLPTDQTTASSGHHSIGVL